MRWLLYTSIGMFFAISLTFADQYDFRNTHWGMSQDDIRISEKLKPVCDNCGKPGQIMYETSVMAKKMALLYETIEDKLVSAGYILIENYTNENKYIESFGDFKEKLTSKYGAPTTDKLVWLSDSNKYVPSQYGMAVSIGDLEYKAKWETDKTDINMMLNGNDYKITCGIIYYSKEFNYLRKNQEKAKINEDL
jgi:hypothetical protein